MGGDITMPSGSNESIHEVVSNCWGNAPFDERVANIQKEMIDSIRFAHLIKTKFQESMDSNRDLKNQIEKLQASLRSQESSLTVQQSCLEPEEQHQQWGTASKETQRFEEPLEELAKLLSGLRSENAYEGIAETTGADACKLETMDDLKPFVWDEVPAELTLKEEASFKVSSESLHKDVEESSESRSGSIEPETEPVSDAPDDISETSLLDID